MNAFSIWAATFLITLPNAALADDRLSKDEVMELFIGKTVHYTVIPKNLDVVAYFDSDGEAREMSGNTPDTHPWWVKDNGQHCIHFKGKKKPSCMHVVRKEDGTHAKYKKGKLIVQYRSFEEGNANNL